MLLQALYEFAEQEELFTNLSFENRLVRWIIPLDKEGNMISEGVIEISDETTQKGKLFSCPRTIRGKKSGGVAEFLTDTMTAVFGLDGDLAKFESLPKAKKEKREENNKGKCEDFWKQIEQGSTKSKSYLLKSLLNWYNNHPKQSPYVFQPTFLRWGKKEDKENEKEKWWIKTSSGEKPLAPGDRFSFQVDGEIVLLNDEIKQYWKDDVSAKEHQSRSDECERSFCILSGNTDTPISNIHPAVKKIPNAQAESYLVSYSSQNKGEICSFASFGWKKGENVPISIRASDGYSLALNHLLSHADFHIRIGPSVNCFWTREHNEFNQGLIGLFNHPSPTIIKDFFKKWRMGINDAILEQDRFYCISLTGNAGRAMVRHWYDTSLLHATKNVETWFQDLELQHYFSQKEDSTPLSIFRLACTTVRDTKSLQPEIPTRLLAAAVEGTSLPITWLKPILHRFYCDLVKKNFPFNPSRFALLKLILLRNRKGDSFMPTPILTETDDKPYNLGRLMAVLEYLQDASFEFQLEGAGVVDKYYGSASSTPATIFPLLLRLARHHLKKLDRSGEKGKQRKYFIEKEMETILALVQPSGTDTFPSFPRTLNLEEQGRFALGFYQQKAHDAHQIREHKQNQNNKDKKENDHE